MGNGPKQSSLRILKCPTYSHSPSPSPHALHLYFSLGVAHTSHPSAISLSVFYCPLVSESVCHYRSHIATTELLSLSIAISASLVSDKPPLGLPPPQNRRPLVNLQSNALQNVTCVSKAGISDGNYKAG